MRVLVRTLQVLHGPDPGTADLGLYLPTRTGQHNPELLGSLLLRSEGHQRGGALLHLCTGNHSPRSVRVTQPKRSLPRPFPL